MFTSIALFFTDSSESDCEDTSRLHTKAKILHKRSKLKQALHQYQGSPNKTDCRRQFRTLRDASNVLELPEEQLIFCTNYKLFV